MLTAEQLERYIYGDATNADEMSARAQLDAMRTPITAEALAAAGWSLFTGKYGGEEYARDINANLRVVVGLWNDTPTVLIVEMGRSVVVSNVRTMHDLAELVRLMGGERC